MKKSKEYLKTLYRLESLIANGGDEEEINELRIQLGVDSRSGKSYIDFCPVRYKKMVDEGLREYQIAKEFGMSHSTLYINRVKHGLV